MSAFQQKHGRPKPPRIFGVLERHYYEMYHPHVLTVFKDRNSPLWAVCSQDHARRESRTFYTHAQAIAWAQKHAHNRNESGGEMSGA